MHQHVPNDRICRRPRSLKCFSLRSRVDFSTNSVCRNPSVDAVCSLQVASAHFSSIVRKCHSKKRSPAIEQQCGHRSMPVCYGYGRKIWLKWPSLNVDGNRCVKNGEIKRPRVWISAENDGFALSSASSYETDLRMCCGLDTTIAEEPRV